MVNSFYVGQKVSLKEELIGGRSVFFSRSAIKDNDGTIVDINFNNEYPLTIDWKNSKDVDYTKCYRYGVDEVVPKGMKRKLNSDDPWGEENWGWEEVKENNNYKGFNIGDEVFVHGHMSNIHFTGQKGTVIKIFDYSDRILVKFPERFDDNLHDGNGDDETNSSYYIDYELLTLADNKKRRRKQNLKDDPWDEEYWGWEFKRKTNPDDDPWNEEDWGWEEVSESNKFDNLIDYYIPFKTKEEMITIAKKLDELEYIVANYREVIVGVGFDNPGHKVYCYHKGKFMRATIDFANYNNKKKLSLEDLIGFKKGKRITNPDVDPWNEEDWGWEEIK